MVEGAPKVATPPTAEQPTPAGIEAQAYPEHINMPLSIPPKYSVSQIMGCLKGKINLVIFCRHVSLKRKYGDQLLGAIELFVGTVGRNKKQIQEYIKESKWRRIKSRIK